jgi:hypothetical protein
LSRTFLDALPAVHDGADFPAHQQITAMIVVPVDIEALVQCAVLALVFEVLRMGIAFFLARPSSEILKLESDKFDAQAEVAKIKSVQLELVKHSKLTRSIISIEKKIENLQAAYYPRLLLVRKICRIVRVSFRVEKYRLMHRLTEVTAIL